MDPRRIKFEEEITRLNGDHVKWFTGESIEDMIEKIKRLKDGTQKKTPNDYKLLKRYDVVDIPLTYSHNRDRKQEMFSGKLA